MATAVLGNFSQAQKAVATSMNSAGSAAKENERYMESLEAKVNALRAAFQNLILGDGWVSDAVKNAVEGLTRAIEWLGSASGKTATKYAALVGGIALLGKTVTKVSKTIRVAGTVIAGVNAGLATTEIAAGVASGSVLTFGAALSTLLPYIGIAVAIAGALYGGYKIYQQFFDEDYKLDKAKERLDDIESKMSDFQGEYDALRSKGENLNEVEKKRIEYLEKQLELLRQQKTEGAKDVAKASENDFSYVKLLSVNDSARGGEVEVVKGLKAVQKALKDTKSALDDYVGGYDPAKETVEEYNNRLSEQVDQFDDLIDNYYATVDAGGELSDEQKQVIEDTLALKRQFADLTGATYETTEAELKFKTQQEMARTGTVALSAELQNEIAKFYGVEASSDLAKQAIALYQVEAIAASGVNLSNALLTNANGFLDLAEAAGIAIDSIQSYQNLQAEVSIGGEHGMPHYSTMKTLESAVGSSIISQAEGLRSRLGQTSGVTPTGGGNGGGGGGGTTTPNGGGGGSASDEKQKAQKKAQNELEKYMKEQLALYQKGEISATKYYNRITAKATELKKDLASGDYTKYTTEAIKEIFEELEYRYEKGEISLKTYTTKTMEWADKALDRKKITYEEWREYKDKTDKLIEEDARKKAEKEVEDYTKRQLEKYQKGEITAEKYYERIWKYVKDRQPYLDAGTYTEETTQAIENIMDNIQFQYDNGQIAVEEYYESMNKWADKALDKNKITFEEWRDKVIDIANEAGEGYQKAWEVANAKVMRMLEQSIKDAQAIVDRITGDIDYGDIELEAMQWYSEQQQDAIQKIIDSLEEERDALQEQNDEREKAIELEKLQQALAEAKTKKTRVYKAGVGFVYTEDVDAIAEAQANLTEYQRQQDYEKSVSDIDSLIEMYQKQKQSWADVVTDYSDQLHKLENEQVLGMSYEEYIQGRRITALEKFTVAVKNQIQEQLEAYEALWEAQKRTDEAQSKYDAYSEQTTMASSYNEQNGYGSVGEAKNAGWKYVGYDQYGGVHYTNQSKKRLNEIIDSYNANGYKQTAKGTLTHAAGGMLSMPLSQFANINELGDELIVPPNINSGNLAYLGKGTGVVPANMTQNLMEIGKFNLSSLKDYINQGGISGQNVIQNFENINLPNVQNVEQFIKELKNLANFRNVSVQASYGR